MKKKLKCQVKNLHLSNNHESDVNMLEMYKRTGIDITTDFRKVVEEVVNSCEICQY